MQPARPAPTMLMGRVGEVREGVVGREEERGAVEVGGAAEEEEEEEEEDEGEEEVVEGLEKGVPKERADDMAGAGE